MFYWPFQGGTSFVDLLCFCSVLCLLCFVRVCLYVLRGHLLGKGWPLGFRLWCLLWVCHFPIGILGQVWYLIVSIPDLCNLTYFSMAHSTVLWWSSLLEFTIQRCAQSFHQISNLSIAHMIFSWSFRCRCFHIIIAACIFLSCWEIHSSSCSVWRTIRSVNQNHLYTDSNIAQLFIRLKCNFTKVFPPTKGTVLPISSLISIWTWSI